MRKRNSILYVGDIAVATKVTDLREYFSRFGTVSSVDVIANDSRHFALIKMANKKQLEGTIASPNHCICGNYVIVRGASCEDIRLSDKMKKIKRKAQSAKKQPPEGLNNVESTDSNDSDTEITSAVSTNSPTPIEDDFFKFLDLDPF